ncbi:hypothetical protein Tco_0027358 [Tanacetum coccineum]
MANNETYTCSPSEVCLSDSDNELLIPTSWSDESKNEKKGKKVERRIRMEKILVNALGYSTFRCNPDLGVLQIGIRAKVIKNQRVTYTFVYTESEASSESSWRSRNEEIFDRGFSRVIVLGYDGSLLYAATMILINARAYIHWYIHWRMEMMFSAEEQPLPLLFLADGSPRYVCCVGSCRGWSDDDGDSSGDDADDKDEDEGDEDDGGEEEEPAISSGDSAVLLVPIVELVSPPDGTNLLFSPPSMTLSTRVDYCPALGFHIPSTRGRGERLARCTAPSAHSSPPPALVDAVTALPTPLLPPLLPSLYIPPPVDRRDDILEFEQPPRKRSCLSTLGSWHKVRESSTARPTRGRGVDYGFVSTIDAEARRQGIREVGYGIRDTWVDPAEAVPKIAPMTLGEVNTRVTELAELHEHDIQDLYALLEDA